MRHRCYGRVNVLKHSSRDAVLAILGCTFVLGALGLIWGSRIAAGRDLYVSELGAVGMTTRHVFMAALLSLVIGGVLIGWAGRGVRAEVAVLRRWTPAVSLWIASGLFFVASQVTCTYGCPVPIGAAFTWQDTFHIVAAVSAFAFSCWAMLQASFARHHPAIAAISGVCAWSVAVIAGTGGLLGLFSVAPALGSSCEFVAMTIAICWVILFGVAVAAEHLRERRRAPFARDTAPGSNIWETS